MSGASPEEITIAAEGVTLAGHLWRPAARSPTGAIVMAPGLGGVKEQILGRYAARFVEAGLAVLAFDHRHFGASSGEPRQEIDPWLQVRDYRAALTYLEAREGIDPKRLGAWGTSFGAGNALVVAALDRRVRCVVAQIPFVSGYGEAQRRVRPDLMVGLRKEYDADRRRRQAGHAPAMIPLVAKRPGAPCAMQGEDAWRLFEAMIPAAPRWRNEITLRSLELVGEYEPITYVARISPTPLLMIVARDDLSSSPELALEAYAAAREPKRLTLLDGGHFDVYGSGFDASAEAAAAWFTANLLDPRQATR